MIPTRKWLIVDTDAGTDDAVALCMSMQQQKENGFELKLITTCFGNVNLEKVNINV